MAAKSEAATASWAVLALLVLSRHACSAQMDEPLTGQGDPPETETKVFINAYLDRLLSVDDKNYEFKAIVDVTLNWRDPRAIVNILNRTEQIRDQEGGECQRVCDGPPHGRSSWQPCCDTLWLPDLRAGNVEELPEGRIARESVTILGANQDVVQWTVQIEGLFYTVMNFRDFPFDEQDLGIKFSLGVHGLAQNRVQLVPSSTGYHNPSARISSKSRLTNDLDGWSVDSVVLMMLEPTNKDTHKLSSASHPEDPGTSTLYNPQKSVLVYDPANNSVALEQSESPGFFIIIRVDRVWYMHILNLVLPNILCMWLALAVFYIDPSDLETRLGMVVTLFLALVAVQFVANDQQPSSQELIATQQLAILTFFCLGIVCFVSILSYRISRVHERNEKLKEFLVAEEAALDHLAEKGVTGIETAFPIKAGHLMLQRRAKKYHIRSQPEPLSGSELGGVLSSACTLAPGGISTNSRRSYQEELSPVPTASTVTSAAKAHSSGEVERRSSMCFEALCCWCPSSDNSPSFRDKMKKMGATLYYLPATVRKVKNYGEFVAWQLDKAAFWVLTVFYHITMFFIFLVNDYLN